MLHTIWAGLGTLILTTILGRVEAYNVTLTFSPSDNGNNADSSCAAPDTENSISLSTDFLPQADLGGCLTLSDIFAANSTSNIRNTSYSYSVPGNGSGEFLGYQRLQIKYSLVGKENWDPAKNWSNVLYTQLYDGVGDANDDEDYFAQRNVNFYYGEDCSQGARDHEIVPWYLSNCRADGDCQQFPFSVGSLFIYVPNEDSSDGGDAREKKGKCVLAAEYGAAGAVRPAMMAVGGMFLLVVAMMHM